MFSARDGAVMDHQLGPGPAQEQDGPGRHTLSVLRAGRDSRPTSSSHTAWWRRSGADTAMDVHAGRLEQGRAPHGMRGCRVGLLALQVFNYVLT